MTETNLGIVVVNYGSHALLAANLALLCESLSEATIVVVDNWSTTDERRRITALAADNDWTLVPSEHNLGFGAGMNRGARVALDAGCTHLLLLNPDVAIGAEAVRELVEASIARPGTLLSPRLLRPDGTVWFAGGQLDPRSGLTRSAVDTAQVGPGRWISGACLLVDAGSWSRLGGFDESYFLYWEDIDLSQRFLDLGGELRVEHDIVGVHAAGGTQGSELKSPLYARYMCRNRLRYAARRLPRRDRLRWLALAPSYALRILRRDGYRAALRRPSYVLAALDGTARGAVDIARAA